MRARANDVTYAEEKKKKRWNDSFYFERVDYLALFIFPSIKMGHPLRIDINT